MREADIVNARVPFPSPRTATVGLAFRFGAFRLLPKARLLLAADTPLKVGGRAFDLLVALVRCGERIVSKDELMDLVWPDRVVEENNLQVQMVALRKLIGHDAVETVPGRGYRFTMPVQVDGARASNDDEITALVACLSRPDDVDDDLRLRLVEAVVRSVFPDGMRWVDLARLSRRATVDLPIAPSSRPPARADGTGSSSPFNDS